MSRRNVERIVKKYADQVQRDHKELPESVYPHMLRNPNLFQIKTAIFLRF